MLKKIYLPVACLVVTILFTACAGRGDGVGETGSSASAGEKLFKQAVIGNHAGCVTCHSLEADVTVVGPSLSGIANTAASRIPGRSAEEYIRESILDPNAYVVEGFIAGTMPLVWANMLSDEQVSNLVAYLMTLK